MNIRKLTLSQAVDGYLLNARARRLTEDTIAGYTSILRRVTEHFPKEQIFADITVEDWEEYLIAQENVSDKTLLNHHNVLSALYTWAVSRRPPVAEEHLLQQIRRPKPEERVVEPLSKADVMRLLSVVETSRAYHRTGKRTCANTLPEAQRNRCTAGTHLPAHSGCVMGLSGTTKKCARGRPALHHSQPDAPHPRPPGAYPRQH